jgi:Zn finger protein HypA/HybF involved in hydrogenase expression
MSRQFARAKEWKCQECGWPMTLKQAQRAAEKGCPNCGGSDVDLAVSREAAVNSTRYSDDFGHGGYVAPVS